MSFTPWGSVVELLSKGIDKIWPDPAEAAAAKARLIEAQQAGNLKELEYIWDNAKAQIDVNKAEAESKNVFVAGWRPFIGWICGIAFGYTFVVQPFMTWVVVVNGVDVSGMPELNISEMMPVLLGLLGLGAMRSYDKKNSNNSKLF